MTAPTTATSIVEPADALAWVRDTIDTLKAIRVPGVGDDDKMGAYDGLARFGRVLRPLAEAARYDRD